jgi:hypothetical protein
MFRTYKVILCAYLIAGAFCLNAPGQVSQPPSSSPYATPSPSPAPAASGAAGAAQTTADEAKGAAATTAPVQLEITLGKLAGPPVLDGVLGDGEWEGAARAELRFQVRPGDNVPPTEKTEVMLACDREHLYVAFRALDSSPGAIRAPVSRRDAVFGDDYVALYLDTYDDRRRSYVFYFNPLGVQADGLIDSGGGGLADLSEISDLTWDGIYTSKGTITKDGYVVEAAIPFKSLRFQAGEGKRWGMHLQRWIARKQERVFWQPVSRDRAELLAQMGALSGLADVYAGRTLDLIPTLTGSINGEREAAPQTPAGARLNNVNRLDPGLTAVYAITPNLSFSAAINPDFSQIEADVPQINVNQRFPLFFPERRPFFLEGAEVFVSPGASWLVNTRSIIDPDWGVKLTGKVGKNTVGYLAASDRAPGLLLDPSDPHFGENAQLHILRYARDVLKNSRVGFFYTDRRFAGGASTLYAADGQIRFREVNQTGWQLAYSRTREDRNGPVKDGANTYFWYEHRGRHWRLFVNDWRVARDYREAAGFIRRTGFHSNSFTPAYEFQAKEKSWWVSVRPFVVAKLLGTDEGLVDESYVDPGADIKLARGVSFYVYHSFHKDSFAGREYPYQFSVAYYTVNTFKRVSFDGHVQFGEGVNFDPARPGVGRSWQSQTGITVKPSNALSFEFSHIKSNLQDKRTGERLFNQDIFRNRTTYQLTRFNSVRAIFDYDTAQRQTGVSLLYAYTPRPNTALFVGYNDLLFNGLDPLDNTRAPGLFRQRRTLFTKLSYNFRF